MMDIKQFYAGRVTNKMKEYTKLSTSSPAKIEDFFSNIGEFSKKESLK